MDGDAVGVNLRRRKVMRGTEGCLKESDFPFCNRSYHKGVDMRW